MLSFSLRLIFLVAIVFFAKGDLLEELEREYSLYHCGRKGTSKVHACRCAYLAERVDLVREEHQRKLPESVKKNTFRSLEAPYDSGSCVDGFVAVPDTTYACKDVDLGAHIKLADLGQTDDDIGDLDDIWGWTHEPTGQEFAIVCGRDKYVYVNVTDPTNPGVVAWSESLSSSWHDVKVYKNYAFMVSEAKHHHLRIFNLETLLTLSSDSPQYFSNPPAFSFGKGTAHNIVINEDSGYAYIVGSGECKGGLYMLDIRDVSNIKEAGCYSELKYTHDAQCVNYAGPDADYIGKELCFVCNEDHVAVVDVSDKSKPSLISRKSWKHVTEMHYIHQGWLSEDHRYFYVNDEAWVETHTLALDFLDLDNPSDPYIYEAAVLAIDHNHYVKGNMLFKSEFTAGLRIVDLGTNPREMEEVAYFDVSPLTGHHFDGAWSTFPLFKSCTVVVSDVERGLFILTPTSPAVCGSVASPTNPPTQLPTTAPTEVPTIPPTYSPTFFPTAAPSKLPTSQPTASPSKEPTETPTAFPTKTPSKPPTTFPTSTPTISPTDRPTFQPTLSPVKATTSNPTPTPTKDPTKPPTLFPTSVPTISPSGHSSPEPTPISALVTFAPSSAGPTSSPSRSPHLRPTPTPTSSTPSSADTELPSQQQCIPYSHFCDPHGGQSCCGGTCMTVYFWGNFWVCL